MRICNSESKGRVSFRNLWRPDKTNHTVSIDSAWHWAFCALYWLAKDFYEDANDQVVEPQALIRPHKKSPRAQVPTNHGSGDSGWTADRSSVFSLREQFAKKALIFCG